ncbi:heterokaryon incompatibility protein-domain-containing protein [Xylaria palmicola]|nr:heterokaryon incompatibility protein-domain-containing protein [Xylaria palmicola]
MAFPYPPLPGEDSLRLLTLKAGSFLDPLEGDLTPTAFSSKPKYLALSYTWDAPTTEQSDLPAAFSGEADDLVCYKEATLALNGHDVSIRHNLALGLRYLRSTSLPLILWVDTVCINQADIDERNSQVAIMALVYSRATAVVAWLGLNAQKVLHQAFYTFDQDGGKQLSMVMHDLYKAGNSKELAPWFAGHLATSTTAHTRHIVESRAAAEEALARIADSGENTNMMVMATAYWQRVWVVQEVCLARRIFFVYGSALFVDEDAVQQAHQAKNLKVTSGMKNMLDARRMRFSDDVRLETLIEEFASQMCTDPRDKIYGLLGLANDVTAVESSSNADGGEGSGEEEEGMKYSGDEDVEFIIDYRRAYYDIWCDTVQYLFRCPHYFVPPHLDTDEGELTRLRHKRLTNIVRFAGLVQNTLQDEVERELLVGSAAPSTIPNEEGHARLRGPRLHGRHVVPARGYLAGKILDLGPAYGDFVGSFRHQTAWRTKWRRHYRREPDLQGFREMEEPYAAKILAYDEVDVARVARIQSDAFVAFRSPDDGPLDQLTDTRADTDRAGIIDGLLESHSIEAAEEAAAEPAPSGQVYRFLGTDHCMGLAPAGAAVGDWVLRFWDCDAAVVVRPRDPASPDTVYTLVGRADVADRYDRKGPLGDALADKALTRYQYGGGEDKRIDMVMDWHTLQRVTASIAT